VHGVQPAGRRATIVAASPQGEVAQARQVSVKFSEVVVPFGDLRRPDPMNVTCQGTVPAGTGRWANDRAWRYDFREVPVPGVRCTLKLRAEWKPIGASGDAAKPAAGESSRPAALNGSNEFSFGTGGPAVASMQPCDGGQIAEDQFFLLRLSGAAVEASVLANTWCEVEGIGDTRVVTLRGDDPTIELKIDRAWGPNVFVSVLAPCGRIRDVPWYSFFTWGWKEPAAWVRSFWCEGREYQVPTAMVDLGQARVQARRGAVEGRHQGA